MSLQPPGYSHDDRLSSHSLTPSSSSQSTSSSSAGLTRHQYNSEAAGFAPPALPPRPRNVVPGQRKPVPSADYGVAPVGIPGAGAPRPSAPPLPPRLPPSYSSDNAGTGIAVAPLPPSTYDDANIVDYSRLPPPPPPINEKYGPYPPRKREKWWYPATTKGRRWFWGLILLLIVAIAIVVAICATVIPKKNHSSDDSDSSYDDEDSSYNSNSTSGDPYPTITPESLQGHPLAATKGGVNVGAVGTIAKFGKYSTDHFVMTTNRSIAVTRMDPIVNPNAPASHLHRIHGSSYFTANLTTATEMQKLANCTTTLVQDDKSAYWVAQLFYQFPNGSMQSIRLDRTSLYYFQKAPVGTTIYPFPDNFNLVAGDPMRRAVNYSDPNYTATWWQCYRGGGHDTRTYGFPNSPCEGGLVQAIQFPSCWDGVYAKDADYTSHVAYPTDGTNGYRCPDAFPKKFITLQFETVFATYDYPFNGNGKTTYVLSNGDTSGFGIHADFMNGWKPETLQGVLNECRYMNSTAQVGAADHPANCPHLAKSINYETTYSCRLQTPIIDELVGETSPIEYLPGCNGIWNGNVSKPPCPGDHVEGGYLELTSPKLWLRDEPYVG
ncbi:hypothetical protein CI109_101227 [Kwoniella shandongensis]|uniref:Uncharacterized protein n=1 Tax=Kwoniella shandongensis TaxID=1734106 RepID=A0A5M6BTJ8_9TREE|nr:uncharacterized protein CI109_005454 [Kwoniella shandongensis]KAA5526176.1 hypothetical protein CI109_005454 [Kwoniella shandongensis]